MYKVQYKVSNAMNAWTNHGSYGSEASALQNAERITAKYFMVRVLDPKGNVVWTS